MLLGIDYGKKRIGLAIGEKIPKGAGFLDAENTMTTLERIAKIIFDNNIKKVIIGIPIRLDGSEGEISEEIRDFADKLKLKSDIEIFFEPEGYSSSEAEEILKKNGVNVIKNKGKIDEMAAVLILEQYISNNN